MRLFSGKIPTIADELLRTLTGEGHIEVLPENADETQLDVESVLREYLRTEREIEEEARDLLEARGLGHEGFGKAKRKVAESRKFGLGEDGIDWIVEQLLDLFMHTHHIEEIYAEDIVIRRVSARVLKKHMAEDQDLKREVERRLKNLQEGTTSWDVEYSKVEARLRRLRGLE